MSATRDANHVDAADGSGLDAAVRSWTGTGTAKTVSAACRSVAALTLKG